MSSPERKSVDSGRGRNSAGSTNSNFRAMGFTGTIDTSMAKSEVSMLEDSFAADGNGGVEMSFNTVPLNNTSGTPNAANTTATKNANVRNNNMAAANHSSNNQVLVVNADHQGLNMSSIRSMNSAAHPNVFVYDVNRTYKENYDRSRLYGEIDVNAAMKDAYRGIAMTASATKGGGIDASHKSVPPIYASRKGNNNGENDANGGSSSSSNKKTLQPPGKIRRLLHQINNTPFKWVKLAQVLCGIYILTVTFTPAGALWIFGGAVTQTPTSYTIIDAASPENTANGIWVYVNWGHEITRAVIAANTGQMILLGLSRFSGFFMYPALICVFWSKLRYFGAFIEKTPFSVFSITDSHALHVYCGWIIAIDCTFHTIFHLTRWGLQGNLYLLFNSNSGITGLIVFISTFIIVIPMTLIKHKIKYEIRKYAHYLFWLFAACMTFHAPLYAIPNGGFCAFVFPFLAGVYALDAFLVKAFMSERISTVTYKTLPSGVELTMPVSERFQKAILSGGYGYIMFEWISKHQWHAYSIYESPLDPSCRHMFIAKAGDWTNAVHAKVDELADTVRPVWISGPFPSPYNNAIKYDNMILVAAGIGITPALAAIEEFKRNRRINLIWAIRDASMLVFFLENAKLDESAYNLIFYTGKDPIPDSIENFNVRAHVEIIKERPNLSIVIPNLIEFFESGGSSFFDENGSGGDYNKQESPSPRPDQRKNKLTRDASRAILTGALPTNLGAGGSGGGGGDQRKNALPSGGGGDQTMDGTYHSVWKTYAPLKEEEEDEKDDVEKQKKQETPQVWKEKKGAIEYVQMLEDEHLDTWGVMYCGGRSRLLEALHKETKKFNLPLHEEAFDW